MEEEKKIPGNEIQDDVETGTTENGNNDEATVEVEQSSNEVDESHSDSAPVETAEEPAVEEKMLSQSQVNELVGRARAEGRQSAMKELFGRYGVNDENELNDRFGRGQSYDLLNDEYNTLNGKYGDLAAENALLKTQILPERWDDVKAILGSKGMEVSVENIQSAMATHPEWIGNAQTNTNMATKEFTPEIAEAMTEKTKPQVRKLGSNVPEPKINSEDADAMRWFGL